MDNSQFQTVDDHETNDNDDSNIVKQNKNLVVDDSWTENESVNETQFKSCQNKEETGSECLDQYIIEEKVNKDDSWNEKDSTKDENEIAESEDLRSNNDWNESVNDTQFKSLNEDERHENNDYPIDNDLEQNNSNGNDDYKDIDEPTNDTWSENESVNRTQFKSITEDVTHENNDNSFSQNIENDLELDNSNDKDNRKEIDEPTNDDWPENDSVNGTQFKSLNEDGTHENNDYFTDNDLKQNISNRNDNNKDIDGPTNDTWSENESVNRTQFKSITEDVTHENNDNSFSQNIENDLELDNSNDKDNRKEIDEPTNDDWPENDSVNGTQFKSLNEDGTHENNDYFTDQNAGNDLEEDKSKENDDIKEIAEPTNNSWSENESFNGTQFKSINEDVIHENNDYFTDQHDLQQDNSNGNDNKEIDEPSNDDWSENDSIKSLNEVVSHENSDYPNENDLEQDISEENDDIKEIGEPPNDDWSENETVNNTQFESMNDTGQVEVDESREQENKEYDNGQGNIFNI